MQENLSLEKPLTKTFHGVTFNIIESSLYHANPDLYAIYGKVSAFTIPDDDYEYTFKLIKNSNEISEDYHYRLVISRVTRPDVTNPIPHKVLESIPIGYPIDKALSGIDRAYRLFGYDSHITKTLQLVLSEFIHWHHDRHCAPFEKGGLVWV